MNPDLPLVLSSPASAATTQRGVINNLQVLRIVAASLVVLYHLRSHSAIAGFDWNTGQSGVDIFFVISGFIIAHATRSDAHVGRFLRRRIIRIVPLYWTLTLIFFAALNMLGQSQQGRSTPGFGDLVFSLLFLPYDPRPDGISPILFLGWTLNFEFFFYAVMAFSMWISHRWRIEITSAIIVGLVLIGLAIHPDGAIPRSYTNPLMLEFVAGLLLSKGLPARPDLDRRRGLFCALAVLALFALLLASDALLGTTLPRIVQWGLPATAIVGLAVLAERSGASLRWQGWLLLGNASYAVYLVHPFVIKAAEIAMARIGRVNEGVFVIVTLVAVIFVSILLHLIIEKPVMAVLTNRIAR